MLPPAPKVPPVNCIERSAPPGISNGAPSALGVVNGLHLTTTHSDWKSFNCVIVDETVAMAVAPAGQQHKTSAPALRPPPPTGAQRRSAYRLGRRQVIRS